jgi:hypothetical protein
MNYLYPCARVDPLIHNHIGALQTLNKKYHEYIARVAIECNTLRMLRVSTVCQLHRGKRFAPASRIRY